MNTKIASIAASIPLILGTAGVFASEPDFHSPTTDRAQVTQPLLARAAHAVNAGGSVSNLWIYPTAEEDVVLAQYVVTTNKASVAVSEQHLELLKLKSGRIVEQSDLTRAGNEIVPQTNDHRDWTASIGTGHAVNAPVTVATGSPASAHWSASIGTGQITGDSKRSLFATTGATSAHAPNAHWTSKIGSAHASDSNTGKVTS